jgi:DNA helicase HerA-like ATPase
MMDSSGLYLGWQVNHALDPGNIPVQIEAKSIAKHTAIVAQSGSGKSFFLGRFVEEILLRTKARILLLDPNGDFLGAKKIEGEELWTKGTYDPTTRRGKRTHELSRTEFSTPWNSISKRIRGGPSIEASGHQLLDVHWPNTDARMIAADFDPSFQYEIVNCHKIIQSLGVLFDRLHHAFPDRKSENLLKRADDILRSPSEITSQIDELFDIKAIAAEIVRAQVGMTVAGKISSKMHDYLGQHTVSELNEARETVIRLSKYVDKERRDYYFRRSHSISSNRIFRTDTKPPESAEPRLDILDLSSLLDHESKQIAVNAVVGFEVGRAINRWRKAVALEAKEDKRVPTFVIVDEAHNVMPSEPRDFNSSILREQFRTIAAEGRKYGLFLVVVSQRPDKIDPMVLSECENKVIMRMGSETVLRKTADLLGLEDIPKKELAKVLDFPVGRAILSGAWIPETHKILFGAAKRTVEGGRNLLETFWARPSDDSGDPAVVLPKIAQQLKKKRAKSRKKKTRPAKK